MTNTQITSANLFNPANFAMKLQRTPHINFFVTDAIVPGLSLPSAIQATPLATIHRPGDKIEWQPFAVNFKIDEAWASYIELFSWIVSIGHPQSTEQYRKALEAARVDASKKLKQDISLFVLSSSKNAMLAINFIDCLPTGLSQIPLSTQNTDVTSTVCMATFEYTYFTVESLAADLSLFNC